MCGRAFDHLGITPVYVDPGAPELPSDLVPDAVLLSREWSVNLRQMAFQARRSGIPVIYVMDGIIEWAYLWENWGFVKPEGTVLQPLIASDLCVIGHHPARILAGLGLAENIHIVGMPRLDELKRERLVEQDQTPRVVIATAKTFGHNTAHKVYVRAALRDLKEWFAGHPEVTPSWRIDPRLAEELGITASFEVSLVETLRSAAGLISFASTALLESMLLGIPTAQIDYRAVPQYVQTAWEIRSAEQIDGVIQELLFSPPEKFVFQEACLRDELELGNASARLADVINLAVERKVIERKTGERVVRCGGQLDFRQVHSHLSAFSVSPMARLQYELDSTYQIWDRDRQRLRELRDDIRRLLNDRWIVALTRMTWLPGVRKTARLIKELKMLD